MRNALILAACALLAVAVGIVIYLMSARTAGIIVHNASSSSTVVPAELLVAGAHSAIDERVNYLITSPAEFNELWNLVQATTSMPDVDFSTHAVLAVFAGQEPTAGYAIGVAKVEDSSSGRMVTVSLTKPGTGCMTAEVVTTPFALVLVPKTALPLSHQDVSAISTCAE